jgi:hypothetical protein
MSRQATDWLAENLAEINKTTLPNGRGLGQDGMALLFYFCDRTNPKDGVFFMDIKTMMHETGLSMTAVKRLLAQFREMEWITPTGKTVSYMGRGKPSVEYLLTLVPAITQKYRTGAQEGAQLGTSNHGKPVQSLDTDYFLGLEPEPEPDTEPEPEPGSVVSKSARQEKEGISVDEVLRICIELETEGMTLRGAPIQPGIVKSWKADYSRLIAQAIAEGHGDTADDVAWHCHNLRTEARTGRKAQGLYAGTLPRPAQGRQLPNALKGMEGCLVCDGQGYALIRDDAGIGKPRKCVCAGGTWTGETTQVPTQERVSTDQSANTYIPTPGASADPQSDARDLRDITGQLMRRMAQPIKPLPE